MERYVFFDTQSGKVLHSKDFCKSKKDPMQVALEAYSLLQCSDFEIQTIEAKQLTCILKANHLPLGLITTFAENCVSLEDAKPFCESMLSTFESEYYSKLQEKPSFKPFLNFVRKLVDECLDRLMSNLLERLENPEFMYLSFPEYSTVFSSATSSLNTEFPEKHTNKRHKRFRVQETYSKLVKKTLGPSAQLVQAFLQLVLFSAETLAVEGDEPSSVTISFNSKSVVAVCFNQMVLLTGDSGSRPSSTDIHALYSWGSLLC